MNTEYSEYTISIYDLILNNFDFDLKTYEIFDEEYRPILNEAILNFYKFREIGFTNPAVFRDRLNYRMVMLMRNKYNALYKAKMIEFNPLYNVEIHETFTHTIDSDGQNTNKSTIDFTTNNNNSTTTASENKSNSNETSSQSAENLNLSSQYPSDEMSNDDFSSNVFLDGGIKATTKQSGSDINIQNGNSNSTGKSIIIGVDKTINSNDLTTKNLTTEKYSKDTVGSSAGLPFSRAMLQLKDYLDEFQLDQQIIKELSDLFISCW